jgi:hypothetical protein
MLQKHSLGRSSFSYFVVRIGDTAMGMRDKTQTGEEKTNRQPD